MLGWLGGSANRKQCRRQLQQQASLPSVPASCQPAAASLTMIRPSLLDCQWSTLFLARAVERRTALQRPVEMQRQAQLGHDHELCELITAAFYVSTVRAVVACTHSKWAGLL
jgi:hypothetical protein